MLFYLTTLNLAHILYEDELAVPTTNATIEQEATLEACIHSDFLCWKYILNGLDDILDNIYSTFTTVKEFGESLEKKYKTEDAGMKKFIVGCFLDYKLVDSIPIVKQLEDLQVIINLIHIEVMTISDPFQGINYWIWHHYRRISRIISSTCVMIYQWRIL